MDDVPQEASRALARMAGRTMRLQVTIQEGHIMATDGDESVSLELRRVKSPAGRANR